MLDPVSIIGSIPLKSCIFSLIVIGSVISVGCVVSKSKGNTWDHWDVTSSCLRLNLGDGRLLLVVIFRFSIVILQLFSSNIALFVGVAGCH